MFRFAFPLIMILAPRMIPRFVRTGYVVLKLLFDSRVPLLLRLLVPASLLYFVHPISRLPYLGPIGFLALLFLASFILLNLAPRDVVEGYAPWRARDRTETRTKGDSSRVVEGRYHLVDEEETTK